MPATARYTLYDTLVPGFGLRVFPFSLFGSTEFLQ